MTKSTQSQGSGDLVREIEANASGEQKRVERDLAMIGFSVSISRRNSCHVPKMILNIIHWI